MRRSPPVDDVPDSHGTVAEEYQGALDGAGWRAPSPDGPRENGGAPLTLPRAAAYYLPPAATLIAGSRAFVMPVEQYRAIVNRIGSRGNVFPSE
jgi:hypothetical protein